MVTGFFLSFFFPPPTPILVIFLAQKNWEDLDFYFFLGGLPNVDFLKINLLNFWGNFFYQK